MSARTAARVTAPRRRLGVLVIVLAMVFGLLAALEPRQAAQAAACPCNLFGTADPPAANQLDPDTTPVELGVKFQSNVDGSVTGVRFWKGTKNTGTHTGSLWTRGTGTANGTRLATVTFTGETARGWQTATFASPVAIKANTTYIVSYYAPKAAYAASDDFFATSALTNGPLTALQNGTDGGQGVYRYGTGGGYPISTYKSSNYYVDPVFSPAKVPDTVKPTLTDQKPAPGATGVARNSSVTVTFSEAIDPATLTMTLSNGTTPVPATQSYDPTAKMATLRPNAVLANTTTYTVNVSGAQDVSENRNQMVPVTWTFTSNSDPGNCPCSVWNDATVPAIPAANDNSATELGMRFRSSLNGFVTGVRFYKGTGNNGTHVGSIWTNTGTKLSSVTFSNETATGWQTATFGAPVAISANTTYVISYYAPLGYYAAQNDFFTTTSTQNGPLTALQDGVDGNNGLYQYGGSAFPTGSYRQTNYWVDPVFDTSANDNTPPTVVTKVPEAGTTGNAATTTVKAGFSEPIDGASVAMELRSTADNALVASTVAYDASSRTATLTPSATLAYNTGYTVKVSGAKDSSGNVMADTTWTFTTGAAPNGGTLDQGPGGPIALVTSSSNPYSKYYAEILRTEGLNEFSTIDVSTLSASTLSAYDTVVLGEVPVTADQASTLTTWVNAGGNLVAMRPSATLSSLLGLTAASPTVSEGYIKVDATTAPGAGIVTDTIQFHGVADRYAAASGTTTVAALYSDATTAAGAPAVTLRNVGSNNGQAVAFTYDLAKSVALTRQGNLAVAGQERDGRPDYVRSDDMFFSAAAGSVDWVNRDKVAIPQADEQQRLLANVIQVVNRDKKPLPRFWYFPNSAKAVIVGTGDDHANNGTAARFDQYNANSPAGCSVANWTCLRYSSFIYPNTPLSNTAAKNYTDQGFEIGVHTTTNGAATYTPQGVADIYANDLASWRARFPSLPTPTATRMHAIVFSDWASQPKAEVANNIRMDTNYYWWPSEWVGNRPGFMTGSGMPMRFTDTDGTMIDNYQANSELTDESGQTYPYNVDTLLDNAIGATGYYGAFVANMHTDLPTEPESDALITSAKNHGNVPIVSGRQMANWIDGRNASAYKNVGWSNNALTFTVSIGVGANQITSMIPTAGPNGTTLKTITSGGAAVSFAKATVKGLEYASFNPTSATYVATYGATTLAVKSNVTKTSQVATKMSNSVAKDGSSVATAASAATTSQTANVSWTTTAPATSQVLVGTSPSTLKPAVSRADTTSTHTASVTGLKPSTKYYYKVVSTSASGATASSEPATFTTAAADITAPVLNDLVITPQAGGIVKVSWTTNELAAGGVRIKQPNTDEKEVKISKALTLDHQIVISDLNPGQTYLITAGSQDAAGNRTLSTVTRVITPALGVSQDSAPTFRTGAASGKAFVTDATAGAVTLSGDVTTARSGSFTSNLLDAQQMVDWDATTFGITLPKGTTRPTLWVRTGSTSKPDDSWSGWAQVTGPKWLVNGSSRYLQYRIDMTATAGMTAASVTSIGFSNNATPVIAPHE